MTKSAGPPITDMPVETPHPGLDPGWLYRTPSTKFKFAFGIGFGVLVGTCVGVGTMLLGLAQDWRVIPPWVFTGALLGSVHPTVDVILCAISGLDERLGSDAQTLDEGIRVQTDHVKPSTASRKGP